MSGSRQPAGENDEKVNLRLAGTLLAAIDERWQEEGYSSRSAFMREALRDSVHGTRIPRDVLGGLARGGTAVGGKIEENRTDQEDEVENRPRGIPGRKAEEHRGDSKDCESNEGVTGRDVASTGRDGAATERDVVSTGRHDFQWKPNTAVPSAVPIDAVQPSQLFIDASRIKAAIEWFDPDEPAYDPIPVVRTEADIVMTDGHTRAFLAYVSGARRLAIVKEPDYDTLPPAYVDAVRWCREEEITTIADLTGRVVSRERFLNEWVARFQES